MYCPWHFVCGGCTPSSRPVSLMLSCPFSLSLTLSLSPSLPLSLLLCLPLFRALSQRRGHEVACHPRLETCIGLLMLNQKYLIIEFVPAIRVCTSEHWIIEFVPANIGLLSSCQRLYWIIEFAPANIGLWSVYQRLVAVSQYTDRPLANRCPGESP